MTWHWLVIYFCQYSLRKWRFLLIRTKYIADIRKNIIIIQTILLCLNSCISGMGCKELSVRKFILPAVPNKPSLQEDFPCNIFVVKCLINVSNKMACNLLIQTYRGYSNWKCIARDHVIFDSGFLMELV